MKEFEENKIKFDIDQNKQKINYLSRKNKESENNFSNINSRLTNAETNITSLNSAVSDLQNSTSDDQEEKIELQSYDCYKTKDNIYRDTCWLPRPVGFVAEISKKFKVRVKFDAVSTFDKTITSTAKITFDDEEVFSETKEIQAGATQSVDFEYMTSSENFGHVIKVELRNTETLSDTTSCCIPDFLTIELWGTNVQFISRNNDFCVIPAGNNVVMTSILFDNPQAMLSMQLANENLSLDQSAFNSHKSNNYRGYNIAYPAIRTTFDKTTNNVTYADTPALLVNSISLSDENPRIGFTYSLVPNNKTAIIPHDVMRQTYVAKPLYGNANNTSNGIIVPDFIYLKTTGEILIMHIGQIHSTVLPYETDTSENFDICGVIRLDNNENKRIFYAIVTRKDGSSYFVSERDASTLLPSQKLEIGFGSHVNAYLLANNNIVVFLRVGKNTKKITLELDPSTNYYSIIDTQMIPNVQEYWLTPNGTHFERVANKINYYAANATSPTKSIKTFC